MSNGYPAHFLDRILRLFVNGICSNRPKAAEESKEVTYFLLPFTGVHGVRIKAKLERFVRKHFPDINLRVVFKADFRIRNFFPRKDRLPLRLRSNLVYQYTCGGCNATYIGETTKQLAVRAAQHEGRSERTGIVRKAPAYSSIREHLQNSGGPCDYDFDNFSIVSSAPYEDDLQIHEALLISRLKPSLNEQLTSRTVLKLF